MECDPTLLRPVAGVRAVALAGELDAPDASRLAASLDREIREGATRLVVNLSGVTFATLAALRALLEARARARERGGELVLSAPSPFVRSVLSTVGLDGAFSVFPGDIEAMRYLRDR